MFLKNLNHDESGRIRANFALFNQAEQRRCNELPMRIIYIYIFLSWSHVFQSASINNKTTPLAENQPIYVKFYGEGSYVGFKSPRPSVRL